MNDPLVITGLGVSGISLIVSIWSAYNSSKVGKAQKKLAEAQVEKLEAEEKEKQTPGLFIEVSDTGFSVINRGQVTIKEFSVNIESANDMPVNIMHDYEFPLIEFTPASRLKFLVLRSFQTSSDLNVTFTGKNLENKEFKQNSRFTLD
jgi:hypothetical protein